MQNRRKLGIPALRGRSYRVIEREAAKARRYLLIGPTERVDCVTLFEDLEDYCTARALLRSGVFGGDGSVEGQTEFLVEDDIIEVTLSEESYRKLLEDDGRSRFSFAHELAHAFLHPEELRRLASLPDHARTLLRASPKRHEVFRDTEWQADCFAAAFLMPAEALADIEAAGEELSARVLQDRFGVSHSAACTRLEVYRSRRRELLEGDPPDPR